MTKLRILEKLGIGSITCKEILFLTGAGISTPDPTAFPLGNELHEMLLNTFTTLSPSELQNIIQQGFPFESSCEILDTVFSQHESHCPASLFWELMSETFTYKKNVEWKQSNDLHNFFRHHIQNGGNHITANLDQFIEGENDLYYLIRTNEKINEGSGIDLNCGNLYKFHGDCNRDEINSQGFIAKNIHQGFSNNVKNAWDTLIRQSKLMVVCGYSGSDRYDVNPYFHDKQPLEFDCKIIWVEHANTPLMETLTAKSDNTEMILSKFKGGIVLNGMIGGFLNELSQLLPDMPTITHMTRSNSFRPEYKALFTNTLSEYSSRYPQFDAYKQQAARQILAEL